MLNIDSYSTKLNRREKYSTIKLTYWDTVDYNFGDLHYLFWLEDAQTFSVNDNEIVIPVDTMDSGDKRFEYTVVRELGWNYGMNFPVKHGLDPHRVADFPRTALSQYSLWGEEDNIHVLPTEFEEAGGNIRLEYNVEENRWEVIIRPHVQKIGSNETVSLTLEGSVPALVIVGYGYVYTKKEVIGYTEHYNLVDNELEIELDHVSGQSQALTALQRLLEKYNTLQPTYDITYWSPRDDQNLEQVPARIDHNDIIPQSVSVDIVGEAALKSASDAFPFNALGHLIPLFPQKSLNDINQPSVKLNELQYNLRAFIY